MTNIINDAVQSTFNMPTEKSNEFMNKTKTCNNKEDKDTENYKPKVSRYCLQII